MRIRIIAVSDKMPSWVEQTADDYLKRIAHDIEVCVIPAVKRTKTISIAKAKESEADAILAKMPASAFCILCDEKGKSYTSVGLSQQIEKWFGQANELCFVIGGADGFDATLYDRANAKWSLSPLTFPHPLVRVILAEQLYRADSIRRGHPYHRV